MKNSKYAIELTSVAKKYTLHHEKPTFAGNILLGERNQQFWALQEISIKIKKGERVGLVGMNGSGKTTLLKIIVGITTPTLGTVKRNGKVVSLIELEAGFHPELTGEENIYLNALLIGFSKKDLKEKYNDIIEFADIGQFIDSPLYTYSEGMKLRLGFSILVHSDMDILVLDENIAVGDKDFKEKSYKKIKELFKAKKTIVTASHDLGFIKDSCNRVIILSNGRIVDDGPTSKVLANYVKNINTR
jgi:ABC-type polysaccharide/polyol phosphate transport system ATPase subunit